jgi:C-terminal processing protease CtpA/Prc
VLPGDVIVSIDKIGVEHEDIGFLHRRIRGERLTVVEIGLRRGNDQFCIFVLRHAFHEFDQASRAPAAPGVVRAKNCHVGFDVTDDAPHRVCQIGEVMDIYGKLQGDSQYSNREILEGDTVVGIDGVDVRGSDVGYIHSALWGDSMTAVSITLVRSNKAFTIQVLRHAHYQLDRIFASMSSNHSSAEEEHGSVGLDVTLSHPHEVLEVRDLLGLNGKLQGEPGYSNPAVRAGDTLYAINGRYCEQQDMDFLHQALRGPRLTAVSLTFRRAGTGEKYNIRVLRHKPHEFEKSKAKKMHMSMA